MIVEHSIALQSVVARNLWWGLGLITKYFGNIKCYFSDKWKMQHFYIKNSLFLSQSGFLTPEILLPILHWHCI